MESRAEILSTVQVGGATNPVPFLVPLSVSSDKQTTTTQTINRRGY